MNYDLDKIVFAPPKEKDELVLKIPVDNINPSHYKGRTCLDMIKTMLSEEEYIGFLRGTIFKYLYRARMKNGKEDISKMKLYEEELITLLDEKDNKKD